MTAVKILDKYIVSGFLVSFAVTLLAVTFVMSTAAIFKMAELLAKGIPLAPVLQVFLYSIPFALGFAIPISTLVSSLLVFGRLSSDGEITAMRASGLCLWRIIAAPLAASALLAAVSLYVNSEMVPAAHCANKTLMTQLGAHSITDLLEEGRFISDFKDLKIFIARKKGDAIFDVKIYDSRETDLRREISAKSGKVSMLPIGNMLIDLSDVTVTPFSKEHPVSVYCGKWPVEIPNVMSQRGYQRRASDMNFSELYQSSSQVAEKFPNLSARDQRIQSMAFLIQLFERMALSLSCFTFVLLGIPLGIKAHRKESSVGVGISLFLVFNFYLLILIAESLGSYPEVRPDLIMWTPVIISAAIGSWLVARSN